jgi:hypothetical protein
MMSQVKGPLGLWSFPLLNMLRQLLNRGTASPLQALQPAARNSEQIEWVDWKGRRREINIHRTIETA